MAGATFDEDALYDEVTLVRLDSWHRSGVATHPTPATTAVGPWRRSATTSAVLAAVALGLREVFDPAEAEPVVEEVDVSTLWRGDRAVVFLHVPGAPARSRAIVRPWLVDS